MYRYKLTILLIMIVQVTTVYGQKWKIAQSPLLTPWAGQVSPQNALPEYPRPLMVRNKWKNLNGIWQFQEANASDKVPFGKKLKEQILVPYPWESALSGLRKQLGSQRAWYRRLFTVPSDWEGQKVLLHFGAVDWETVVYINGRCTGVHRGGYDSFSFDITPFLNVSGNQEIIVGVYDPGNDKAIATGKQSNDRFANPRRFTYSPSSGIWQTVWLEPVPAVCIKAIKIIPDIDSESISVTVDGSSLAGKHMAEVTVNDGNKQVGKGSGKLHEPFRVSIPSPKLWGPDSPFLYDVTIALKDSLHKVDEIKSYVGMRKVSMQKNLNIQRIMLNDTFLFQMGPLDQGYWPDGLYTAPTDEALKWEIRTMKEFGYNMVRKHIKIEPQRWYYWCDKLGLLVWQDMPGTFKKRTGAEKTQFEVELQRMVKSHWNHPSIVNWIVFNEHWGIYDPERLTNMVMALDPSRLVTGNSGIDAGKPDVDYEVGHIKDNHHYRPPTSPYGNQRRAIVNGEYGAIGYNVEGHIWDQDGPWVHYNYKGKEAATTEYEKFIEMILKFQKEGLSGAVYTQWTDVENEMNGIYTYDRKVIKLDKEKVKAANESTYSEDKMKEW